MGRRALCDGRSAYGNWISAQAKWHINCLGLKAVYLASQGFLPLVKDRHVLVRTDNTTVVSYIKRDLLSQAKGSVCHPRPAMEPACLAGQCEGRTLNVSQQVLDTIAEARAPSTRHLYGPKWKVFSS